MSFVITVDCEPYDVFLCKLFSGGFVEISGKLMSNGCFEKYENKSLVVIKPRRIRDESHVNREIQYIRFEKYNTVGSRVLEWRSKMNRAQLVTQVSVRNGRDRVSLSLLSFFLISNFHVYLETFLTIP